MKRRRVKKVRAIIYDIHDDYQWLNKKTALKKLTWPRSKELLKEINI